jgi:hypothetical protein
LARIVKTLRRLVPAFALLFLFPPAALAGGSDTEATLFYGRLSRTDFIEIPYTAPQLENRSMLAVSLRRELFSLRELHPGLPQRLHVDAEGLLAQKWGDWAGFDQQFQEVAGSFNLRYEFGKNPVNLRSLSFGNGLSYTTRSPRYESEITLNGRSSRLLYYMMVDIGFRIPRTEKWRFVLRVHHRSGFYGFFDNVSGGSNYLCFGLRRALPLL